MIKMNNPLDKSVEYAVNLMRKNYEQVGFLPKPRMSEYAISGQLWLQYENNEPCGYLVFGNGWPILKVYQCCIQIDAQRVRHASILIRALIEKAKDWKCSMITLWCAEDLESNSFWQAMGFEMKSQRNKNNTRGRLHNGWVYYIQDLFK